MQNKEKLWRHFCIQHQVLNTSVVLFDQDSDLRVRTREIGNLKRRFVLCRSDAMESLIRASVSTLVADWQSGFRRYDGLIYLMFFKRNENVLPLYIGKAETVGRGQSNLSANLANVSRDQSKFARWGDNYAYHIGDLSAATLPGHPPEKVQQKYRAWAEAIFRSIATDTPQLREPVYFWTMPWARDTTGIWTEFGPTRLTFLEYLLIGVASELYPGTLLNREGRNRNH